MADMQANWDVGSHDLEGVIPSCGRLSSGGGRHAVVEAQQVVHVDGRQTAIDG